MINFDKISIDQISKHDFLVILQALDYTYEHTQVEAFSKLKEVLMKELSSLTETDDPDQLVDLLKESL